MLTVSTPAGAVAVPLSATATGSAPPPAATEPVLRGYRDERGEPLRRLPWGAVVTVQGERFGAAPGRVLMAGFAIPVLAWSDTEIRCRVLGNGPLTVWRADGQWVTQLLPEEAPAAP